MKDLMIRPTALLHQFPPLNTKLEASKVAVCLLALLGGIFLMIPTGGLIMQSQMHQSAPLHSYEWGLITAGATCIQAALLTLFVSHLVFNRSPKETALTFACAFLCFLAPGIFLTTLIR